MSEKPLGAPLFFLFVVLMVAFALTAPMWLETLFKSYARIVVWLVEAATLIFLIRKFPSEGTRSGVFLDARNMMSLGRTLTFFWFVLVMSAYLTVALWNVGVAGTGADPLAISIPEQVWMMAGVTTATMLAEPLVHRDLSARDTEGATAPPGFSVEGSLIVRDDASESTWRDIFMSDAGGDRSNPEFARIQAFFVSVIVLVAYAAALAGVMRQTPGNTLIIAFPALSGEAVGLAGLSGLGFIGISYVGGLPGVRKKSAGGSE